MSDPSLNRRTPAQNAVLEALQHHRQPISAQALHSAMRSPLSEAPSRHSISLATIYRSLDALQKLGLIQHRVTLEGITLYSLVECDRHYMTCLHCGQSFPIDDSSVRELKAKLPRTYSFNIFYHTLEIFGVCRPCTLQET